MGANKGFQKHVIDKQLDKRGIKDFDVEGEIDSSLTLSENKDNLEDQLGISLRNDDPDSKKKVRERQSRGDKMQANKRHEARSQKSQLVDERRQAEKVFDLPLEDGEFETWADNPDQFDIEGVDTKGGNGLF